MLLSAVGLLFAQVGPPIINGDETQDYPQVVTLMSYNNNNQGYNFCSGTLIASKWVLTAAHCVVAFDDNERMGLTQHYVVVGYNLMSNNGVQDYAQVKDWTAHENYDDNALRNDIGIVELKTAITSIDPMPVNKDNLTNAMKGDDYRYVGWGITSDNGQDSSKKHMADMPLYDFDTSIMYGYDPQDNQNVCSGDSGGAVLEIISNNKFELAGVNSFVSDNDNTPCEGGMTGGTRVDYFIDWIERFTPVYAADESGGGDADTDSDSDADSDSDTDADADTGNGNANTGEDVGELDNPERPADVGEDYSSESAFGLCSSGPSASGLGLLVGLGAALARRSRRA